MDFLPIKSSKKLEFRKNEPYNNFIRFALKMHENISELGENVPWHDCSCRNPARMIAAMGGKTFSV